MKLIIVTRRGKDGKLLGIAKNAAMTFGTEGKAIEYIRRHTKSPIKVGTNRYLCADGYLWQPETLELPDRIEFGGENV